MTVWCSHCEKWSGIPADLSGLEARVLCEHCGASLDLESRYGLCAECGRYHRTGYEVCPFKMDGMEATPPPTAVVGAPTIYSIEAQKRRTGKRSDDYYWQLYIDYRDRPAEPDAATESGMPFDAVATADEPPHPADLSDYDMARPPAARNGNGYGNGASGAQNGSHAGKNGNGYRNGNGSNGYAGKSHNAQRVDLALAESTPVLLFPEIENNDANKGDEAAPVVVQAGNYNEFEYELINDPSRLAEVAEILARETIVGIDTETTGLDPHTCQLLLLQISTLDKVYVIDCKRLVPLALKPLLENPAVLKVAQNAKFEYEMLKQQAGITVSGMFDTMLAERLITAGIGREISLKAIAQKYIGATLDKSVRESFHKLGSNGDAYLAPEQLHYAARDAFIMIPIYKLQQIELKKHRLQQVAELEFRCIAAVGDMELAGVQIDVERWRKIIADVAVQRDQAQSELAELLAPASMQATMFGVPSINLNSNLQLMEAFATLGVDLPDTMEATLVKYSHPAVAKLLEYRGHEKTLSAFGENVLSLINPKTGRIHPDFNQYGADTGRFSCVAAETLVSTTTGLKRVYSVREGDLVHTSFGPRRVLAAWCNGERPLLKVTLTDGRVLRLTADHRVLTQNGDAWRSVNELSPGDNMFLSLRGSDPIHLEAAPALDIDPGTYYSKRKATIPTGLSIPLCELAGLITADGTFPENQSHRIVRGKKGIRFTTARFDRVYIDCGWEDDEVIDRVIEQSRLLFGIGFRESRHKTARRLSLASTQVAGALAKLGLAGTAHTKSVPQTILEAHAPFQAAYLRGLFEGDGHITEKGDNVGLTSVNRDLLQTVQIMLSFLGCYSSLRQRVDTSGFAGAPRHQLSIAGAANISHFMDVVGFISSRKNRRASNVSRHPIGSVTPLRVSGADLYRDAVSHGLVSPSRQAVKPFVPYYKKQPLGTHSLDEMIQKWGTLPTLQQAVSYRERLLHRVQIASIEADGTGLVYDLTVDGASEFLANGVVVHNCTRPNVQQIPGTSDFRKCFVAAPGYKLVTCDYSQCIARDSWVSTPNSWVRIQDHPDSVSRGLAQTVLLATQRKYQLECTPDHRVLTPSGWMEASRLRPGDWVALRGSANWRVAPFNKMAWLEGFWVGDGCYNRADTVAYFSQGAGESREELRSILVDTLGTEPKEFGETFGVKGQRAFVTQTRAYDKKDLRLPLDKIEHLSSLLCGLFDADGTADKNGVSFSTKYPGLARDIQVSLLRFGVMSTITKSVAGYNFVAEGRLQYQLRISDTPSLENYARHIGFRLTEKVRRLRNTLAGKSTRDQGNYLPVPAELVRSMHLPYKKYVFNHIHGRPYTRVKLRDVNSVELSDYRRYHWDRVESVAPSNRTVEVFDLLDQPGERFEASGFVVHNCELRVLAELSGDPAFVDAFRSGQDLHTLTASQMFGVPVDQVQKPQRSAAKAINFGLAYGMGPGGLAPRLGVQLDEAKELIARYFKAYPGIQRWLDKAAKDAVRLGYSATPLGRKRFYNLPDESLKRHSEDDWRKQIAAIERQGKNSPIQGANADMTKLALINLRAALQGWDARTVNTVHDEIVVEVRVDQAEEVKHIVEQAMVGAGQAILKEVPIVADASLADYWSK